MNVFPPLRASLNTKCSRRLILPGLLALALTSVMATAAAIPDRPNLVFFLADDLGYGDLSCYGQQTLRTPNLDQLAAEGLRFTRHSSGSTVCSPRARCC